jgi:thiamine-monophosphate kinase
VTNPFSNTLSELGEFGLISRIAAEVSPVEGVITGIGDDAAVTALTPDMQLLTSTDMLLEGVHFRLDWHDPWRLGRKSLAVSISDLAAMGARPRWALLSIAIPADCPLDFLDQFTHGFLDIASQYGITLIGGDTCKSKSGLILSVTIMGEQLPEHIVMRSGARPDDDIWVSGTLGDAALGLELLQASVPAPSLQKGEIHNNDDYEAAQQQVMARLLDPVPRVCAGRALAEAGLVTAMIDISDGLVADFGHITEQSKVGGIIRLEALPISNAFRTATQNRPAFPYHLVLAGGEDYELAFTASPANREKIHHLMNKCGVGALPVGIVTSRPGVTVLWPDGSHYTPEVSGFTHFS